MGPEAKLQDRVIRWARTKYKESELVARKNQAGPFGSNGYPDYEFNAINAHTFFIEFKAPGKEATELQKLRILCLRRLGFPAEIMDDEMMAKHFITEQMEIAHLRRVP